MPLRMAQQLHIPPASMVHRFCTMLQAILSSQEQLTFIPPVHFSNFTEQRGTIMKLTPAGTPDGAPPELYTLNKADFVQDALYRLGIRKGPADAPVALAPGAVIGVLGGGQLGRI